MDASLAELCTTADPVEVGRRIRSARLSAGMTQAELAAGYVSAAQGSRIEAGKRRVQFDLLQSFAERLGVSVAQLLGAEEDQSLDSQFIHVIDHAELSLRTGDAGTVVELMDSWLAKPPTADRLQIRRSRRVRALALEALGRLPEAIEELRGLVADRHRDLEWVRDVIALSRTHRDSGHLTRAIEVGEGASAELERWDLAGSPEAIQLALTIAAACYERGDTEAAQAICADALEAADKLGSPEALASAYWNASVVQSRNGDTPAALPLAQRALAIFEQVDDMRNVARLRTQLGILRLRMVPPDAEGALDVLTRAERDPEWRSAERIYKATNDIALARAHYFLDDLTSARTYLERGLDAVAGVAPLAEASALALRGRIEFLEGCRTEAVQTFKHAVGLLVGVGADRSAGEMWYELAGYLEAAGEIDEAMSAYRGAATAAGVGNANSSIAQGGQVIR